MPQVMTETAVVTGVKAMAILPDTSPTGNSCAFDYETNRSKLDEVKIQTPQGPKTVTILAIPWTEYWAIYKYMYLHHSTPVYDDELCRGVERLLRENNPARWEKFVRRSMITTRKKGVLVRQQAKHWRRRLITNMRNLCRIGNNSKHAYGRRLLSFGHVMRYQKDEEGNGYCVMHLTLTPENTVARQRGRKKADESVLLTLPEDIQQMIRDGQLEKEAGFYLGMLEPAERSPIFEEVRREHDLFKKKKQGTPASIA